MNGHSEYMTTKEQECEFVDNTNDSVVGSVWWNPDKKKVEFSSSLAKTLFTRGHSASCNNDKILLEHLPRAFRSGYTSARKVKK